MMHAIIKLKNWQNLPMMIAGRIVVVASVCMCVCVLCAVVIYVYTYAKMQSVVHLRLSHLYIRSTYCVISHSKT